MRRVFALLLITPLLASCADSVTQVAPPGAALANEELVTDGSATEESWTEESWVQAQLSQQEESSLMSMPSSAVMDLGNPGTGSDFPPNALHDQSAHARDRMNPGTVVIPAGGTVTFRVLPGHRVAVYNPGKRPEDVVTGPGNFVLDATNRLFLQGAPTPTVTRTFTQPGRYLVICAITRHFVVFNMYGWVIVQ